MIPGSAWGSPSKTRPPWPFPGAAVFFFAPMGNPPNEKAAPGEAALLPGLLVGALSRICGKVIRGQATEGSRLETLTCAVAEG